MTRKKQDTHERAGDLRQTPFKSLKGFAAAVRPRTAAAAVPPPSSPPEDDDALFRAAMHGAKPLDPTEGPDASYKPTEVPAPERQDEAALDEHVFLDAMRTMGAASFGSTSDGEERPEDEGARSRSSRMRQLRRGTLRIGAELDLHGCIKDEALRRLDHFIASAAARRLEAVLGITGKGTSSPDGPVLPGVVTAWLRGPGLRYAVEFHPAPRDRGGSGAYVVFLRKR